MSYEVFHCLVQNPEDGRKRPVTRCGAVWTRHAGYPEAFDHYNGPKCQACAASLEERRAEVMQVLGEAARAEQPYVTPEEDHRLCAALVSRALIADAAGHERLAQSLWQAAERLQKVLTVREGE